MKRTSITVLALILGTAVMAAAARKPKPTPPPAPASCTAWTDSFNTGALDTSRWVAADGPAPGYIPDQHIGFYESVGVRMDNGMLTLTLLQVNGPVDTNPSGVVSYGALIYTKATCGYGTYEWTMKMSSTAICPTCVAPPVSGSVSAGFLYVNNSETEIDFEFSAMNPDTLWLVNWYNRTPTADPTEASETYTGVKPFNSTDGFHTYRFVWSPGKISFYMDGLWKADHTTNVPSAPARFMINHWGTNSTRWGGPATLGVMRYFYVTKASYTPPQ